MSMEMLFYNIAISKLSDNYPVEPAMDDRQMQLNVNIGGGAGTAALRKTSWRRNLLKCDERHDSTSKSYKRQFSVDANVELQNCAIVS